MVVAGPRSVISQFPGVISRVFALMACVVLVGCASRVPPTVESPLQTVPPGEWPALMDDLDPEGLIAATEQSLSYFDVLPRDRVFTFGTENRTAVQLAEGARRFIQLVRDEPNPEGLAQALKQEFVLLRSVGRDGRGEVLFTGYYEPLLEARRELEFPFEYPVYGVPEDLVMVDLEAFGLEKSPRAVVGRVEDHELVRFADREEIDFGDGLASTTPVLGYLADPVDVFFLHVQGSGTLIFPDGTRLRAGYAVSNGWEYRSIGKLLIDDGLIPREEMSMQAIRAYLAAHPDEIERVLGYNASYVFFRPLPSEGGPLGCYGLPVTSGRSIATDRRLFPAPVMAWIEGTMPGPGGEQTRFSRFVLNQDTGGSIRGPGRVDLFIGAGEEAAGIAGRMNNLGRLYLFLPSSI
ncbi:MAG: MltA domain-containing protein [Acidobacteria bacterium]|nr:MltA domain-containing protein [Candidatus Sulfomarinibacter kjeldsenii]